MIESLARCVKFDASGGKSGSAFLKTLGEFKLLMWWWLPALTSLNRRPIYREGAFEGGTSSHGVFCARLLRLYVVCSGRECMSYFLARAWNVLSLSIQ